MVTFRRRGVSLRVAVIGGVLLPLTGLFGAAGFVGLARFEQWSEARMQEDVELVARTMRVPLGRAIERGDRKALDEILASAFRINRVYGVYLYDSTGSRIVRAGARPERERKELSELAAEGERTGTYDQVGGRPVYSYFVPLTSTAGEINGLLQVTRRRSDFEEYLGRLRWQGAAVLVFGVALMGALVLYGHHRAVGVHVNRLMETMHEVGRGDRSRRATPRGPLELVGVGEALNHMLDEVQRAEDRVATGERHRRVLLHQLRHAEKLAAVGRLAAGVAHELGTPLSIIAGRAQRVGRRPDLPSDVAAALADIGQQVDRMGHIVRQLLDFGRARGGPRQMVTADQVAAGAVAAVRDEFADSGTRLDCTGPPGPPAFWADAPRVEQALVSLLRNARDAARGGHVRVEWTVGDTEANFVVDDDGPGIPDEIRERLFEPFFTTKPVGHGVGLGLAVVHGVAEEHGGHVDVGAAPLGGARFRLTLARDGGAGARGP